VHKGFIALRNTHSVQSHDIVLDFTEFNINFHFHLFEDKWYKQTWDV